MPRRAGPGEAKILCTFCRLPIPPDKVLKRFYPGGRYGHGWYNVYCDEHCADKYDAGDDPPDREPTPQMAD